jgi:hypothetical protein
MAKSFLKKAIGRKWREWSPDEVTSNSAPIPARYVVDAKQRIALHLHSLPSLPLDLLRRATCRGDADITVDAFRWGLRELVAAGHVKVASTPVTRPVIDSEGNKLGEEEEEEAWVIPMPSLLDWWHSMAPQDQQPPTQAATTLNEYPHWDEDSRELSYRGNVIKSYSQPAENQTLILRAFEDAGWAKTIESPLNNPHPQSLGDATHAMNKAQQTIHFERDGRGKIRWRPQ